MSEGIIARINVQKVVKSNPSGLYHKEGSIYDEEAKDRKFATIYL